MARCFGLWTVSRETAWMVLVFGLGLPGLIALMYFLTDKVFVILTDRRRSCRSR